MKRTTVFTAVLACGFAASAVAPAGAIDFKNLTRDQVVKVIPMKMRNYLVMRLHVGCTLYEHANAGGQSWRYEADNSFKWNGKDAYGGKFNLTPRRGAGKVSSLRCDWEKGKARCGALYYLGRDQTGRSGIAWGEYGVVNLNGDFNDKAASISVICDPS